MGRIAGGFHSEHLPLRPSASRRHKLARIHGDRPVRRRLQHHRLLPPLANRPTIRRLAPIRITRLAPFLAFCPRGHPLRPLGRHQWRTRGPGHRVTPSGHRHPHHGIHRRNRLPPRSPPPGDARLPDITPIHPHRHLLAQRICRTHPHYLRRRHRLLSPHNIAPITPLARRLRPRLSQRLPRQITNDSSIAHAETNALLEKSRLCAGRKSLLDWPVNSH